MRCHRCVVRHYATLSDSLHAGSSSVLRAALCQSSHDLRQPIRSTAHPVTSLQQRAKGCKMPLKSLSHVCLRAAQLVLALQSAPQGSRLVWTDRSSSLTVVCQISTTG